MLKRIFIFIFVYVILVGCIRQNDIVPISTPTVNPEILEIDSGKQQSQKILKAIEDYYEDNKVYPTELNELVPNYLLEIPVTITGQTYSYRLFEQYNFILIFGLSRSTEDTFVYCAYLYSIKTWECGLEHLP